MTEKNQGVSTTLSPDATTRYIVPNESEFGASILDEFRAAYEADDALVSSYIVDFRNVKSIERSGFAMLAMLAGHCTANEGMVRMINVDGVAQAIRNLLNLPNTIVE